MIHQTLFVNHNVISLLLIILWFVAATNSLTAAHLKYQLGQLCFAIPVCMFSAIGGPALSMISRHGRFWYFFPQQCIAVNDIFAYAFGKLFGRTKLISVSPNKTVEGFVGGMFCNIVQTWFSSGYMLQSATKEFWICGSMRYDIGIF